MLWPALVCGVTTSTSDLSTTCREHQSFLHGDVLFRGSGFLSLSLSLSDVQPTSFQLPREGCFVEASSEDGLLLRGRCSIVRLNPGEQLADGLVENLAFLLLQKSRNCEVVIGGSVSLSRLLRLCDRGRRGGSGGRFLTFPGSLLFTSSRRPDRGRR